MALKPLHDRVLVRRTESEEKTAGGLIIPESAKEKPSEGQVVATGEGARKDNGELIAMAVKAGDSGRYRQSHRRYSHPGKTVLFSLSTPASRHLQASLSGLSRMGNCFEDFLFA